jgi:hypothetical protein
MDAKTSEQFFDQLRAVLVAQSDRQIDALVKVMSRILAQQSEASMNGLARLTNRKSDALGTAIFTISEQIIRLEREVLALRADRAGEERPSLQ